MIAGKRCKMFMREPVALDSALQFARASAGGNIMHSVKLRFRPCSFDSVAPNLRGAANNQQQINVSERRFTRP